MKKKLYIGCALSGLSEQTRVSFLHMLLTLKKSIAGDFEILEFFSALPTVEQNALPGDTIEERIYLYDMACVNAADCMLAIVDDPSTGLGYEMAVALEKRNIPVVAVARVDSKVSRLILGISGSDKRFVVHRYVLFDTIPELAVPALKSFF